VPEIHDRTRTWCKRLARLRRSSGAYRQRCDWAKSRFHPNNVADVLAALTGTRQFLPSVAVAVSRAGNAEELCLARNRSASPAFQRVVGKAWAPCIRSARNPNCNRWRRGRHAMTCWTRIFDFWLPGDALPMMPLEGELGGYHGPLNDQPRRRNENGLIYQLK
jgi:hypothetical protein